MVEDLSTRAEDYLRGVYDIVERKGYARIKDIAVKLGVQPSSVSEMMRNLHRRGLVVYEKYGGVTLTPRGEDTAKAIVARHETFARFLKIILVPDEIALKDAHVLEHQLDPETILQFTRFVEFIEKAPERPRFVKKWLEQFRDYCEKDDGSGR